MNDRQRTILGVVAVFSLVGVAILSLWMNKSAIVSADVIKQSCTNSPTGTQQDIFVSVEEPGKIILRSVGSVPVASALITFVDVKDPQVTSSVLAVRGNTYAGIVNMGSMPVGSQKEINYELGTIIGDNPCIRVQTSSDGFAYSTQFVSTSIK